MATAGHVIFLTRGQSSVVPHGEWATHGPWSGHATVSARSLSEKDPVCQSRVAVGQMKGDNDSSLQASLWSRRRMETDDERAPAENISALGTPVLSAGGP